MDKKVCVEITVSPKDYEDDGKNLERRNKRIDHSEKMSVKRVEEKNKFVALRKNESTMIASFSLSLVYSSREITGFEERLKVCVDSMRMFAVYSIKYEGYTYIFRQHDVRSHTHDAQQMFFTPKDPIDRQTAKAFFLLLKAFPRNIY